MDSIKIEVDFISSEDESDWLAVSRQEPRFFLFDKSEEDLVEQVKRALDFYAQNLETINSKVRARESSVLNLKSLKAVSNVEFAKLVRKTALIDSAHRIQINAVS